MRALDLSSLNSRSLELRSKTADLNRSLAVENVTSPAFWSSRINSAILVARWRTYIKKNGYKTHIFRAYIKIVVHFCPGISLTTTDKHQFTLKISELIQIILLLDQLLLLCSQCDRYEIMDTLCIGFWCDSVSSVPENIGHLAIRSLFNRALSFFG